MGFASTQQAIKDGRQELLLAYPMDSGVPGTHCVVVTIGCVPYPVGILHYRQATKDVWEILSMLVLDELRGAGIGGKLLAGMQRIAEANKGTAIYTQEVTDKSRKIVTQYGFKKRTDGYWLNLKKLK